MADGDDLRARMAALEARFEALARPGGTDDVEPATSVEHGHRRSLTRVTRRGLLAAAAGAVAGGATSVALAGRDEVDGHVGEEHGAHEASAIAVAPAGEMVATDVLGALVDLDARLGSLLQFSPDFLQDYAWSYDDFFGGSVTSGQVAALGWQVATADGGTLAPATEPIENMPGWYELRTGSGSGNSSCALHLEQVSLHGHPLFVWEARVAIGPPEAEAPDATWRVGLLDSVDGAEPTNGYWFEHRGAGTAVRCRVAQGGEVTEVESDIRPASGSPLRLRIMSDGGGVAYFSVDDESVGVVREGLPDAPEESFGPVISIAQTAPASAGRSLRVDYAYLLWGVAR